MSPKEMAGVLDRFLRTDTFPLGITWLKQGEALPEKAKLPSLGLGTKVAICQGISIARRYGWTVAMGREDVSCPIAKAVFGFEAPLDFYTEGNLAAGMYAKDMAAGRRMEEALDRYAQGEFEYVVAGPLDRITYVPDSVLVYGNSAQVMRLLNAALFEEGGALASEFSGRADCSDIIIKGRQSGEPQVILPCYGDRVFAMTGDHEMAFTFPWPMADSIVEGFEATHRAGVRYPIPQFLRFQAEFPPSYQELERMWEEADPQR